MVDYKGDVIEYPLKGITELVSDMQFYYNRLSDCVNIIDDCGYLIPQKMIDDDETMEELLTILCKCRDDITACMIRRT